jgi:hypothetical protein
MINLVIKVMNKFNIDIVDDDLKSIHPLLPKN